MKLTKSKLKQLIKEELREAFGAASAEDPRSSIARISDQMDAALEAWRTQGDAGDTARMQENFTYIARDLRKIAQTMEV